MSSASASLLSVLTKLSVLNEMRRVGFGGTLRPVARPRPHPAIGHDTADANFRIGKSLVFYRSFLENVLENRKIVVAWEHAHKNDE